MTTKQIGITLLSAGLAITAMAESLKLSDFSKELKFEKIAVGASAFSTESSKKYRSYPKILEGAQRPLLSTSDRKSKSKDYLSFTANRDVYVFIGYDCNRKLPEWLKDWKTLKTPPMTTTDNAFQLLAKAYPKGKITLGANYGSKTMYLLFIKDASQTNLKEAGQLVGKPKRPMRKVLSNDTFDGLQIWLDNYDATSKPQVAVNKQVLRK
jgi:hypothetical protein